MTLKKLSPTQFENLIFDLMINRGMVNVVWRTPGADGGRDIEGLVAETDFSGFQSNRKWYVECKRYKASIDWPTIYKKIAYADSHLADVLLICTQSTISPSATSEVEQWNSKNRRPAIRLWPIHVLDAYLKTYPDLQLKYNLTDNQHNPGSSFISLSLALSKSIGSHYSRILVKGNDVDLMLQSAHALAELIQHRMEDISRYGEVIPVFVRKLPNDFEFIRLESELPEVDIYGLIAVATLLSALTKKEVVLKKTLERSCEIGASENIESLYARYYSTISAICIWSNTEVSISGMKLIVSQRT